MNTAPVFHWVLKEELSPAQWLRFCQEVDHLARIGLPELLVWHEQLPCPPNVWKWLWKKRQSLFIQSHTPAFQWGTRGALDQEPVLELMPGPHRVPDLSIAQTRALRVARLPHRGQVLANDELFFLPIVATIVRQSLLPCSPWSFSSDGLDSSVLAEWLAWSSSHCPATKPFEGLKNAF